MQRDKPLSYYLFYILAELAKDAGITLDIKEHENSLKTDNKKFLLSYRDIDEYGKYVCSMKFDGSAVTPLRKLATGKRYNRVSIITIRAQGDTDKAGLFAPEVFLENVLELLTGTSNHIYYVNSNMEIQNVKDDDCVEIIIVDIENLSGVIDLNKNEERIPRYSIRLKVTYQIMN